jgi:ribulose-5-phosphate 4-epimerase/fuculose-1-phosphate aldolase
VSSQHTNEAGADRLARPGSGNDVGVVDGVARPANRPMFPRPPAFDSVEEERHHRKTKLAGALRIFGRLGFGEGVAGHMTVRDPEHDDCFWVNPFAMSFRHIRASDLLLVDRSGSVLVGSRPVNRAAFVLHSAIHEARPAIVAAAHAHSVYGKAFSTLGIPLAPITQDACAFFDDHVVISDHGGAVVFEERAGADFAAAFAVGKAAVHQNHGLFTVGGSVDAAAFWFITMERNCQAQLAAMAAGTPTPVPEEFARYTFEQTGKDRHGWTQFQPLWQEICASDPELFD